jgi:hypothetical protein
MDTFSDPLDLWEIVSLSNPNPNDDSLLDVDLLQHQDYGLSSGGLVGSSSAGIASEAKSDHNLSGVTRQAPQLGNGSQGLPHAQPWGLVGIPLILSYLW